MTVGALVAALVGALLAVGIWLARSAPSSARDDPATTSEAAVRDAPTVAGRRPRKRVRGFEQVEAEWDRARQHFAAGEWAAGLALLAPARRAKRRFLDDPERQRELLAAEDAALAALEGLLRERRKAKGLAAADALAGQLFGDGRPARLAALREALARLGALDAQAVTDLTGGAETPEDRAQLARHLRRFASAVDAGEPGKPDWVDGLLGRVAELSRTRRRARARSRAAPLPVASEDEAEKRRIEQLEKLRQRQAVGLLDHIHAGLAWLALHQGENGSFSQDAARERCKALGHKPCAKSKGRFDLAATALAVLAFLDFRDQDRDGIFEPSLAAGVTWLLAQQRADGSFPNVRGYSPAIALMALGQAAGSSGRADLKDAVRRALIHYAPDAPGGYRYQPHHPGDLSATGWYVQALEAARDAGVEVPPQMHAGLRDFVYECRRPDGGWSYLAGAGGPRASLRSVGMLSEIILDDLRPSGAARADGGGFDDGVEDVRLEEWRTALARGPRVLTEESFASADRLDTALYTLYYDVRVQLALDGELTEGRRQRVFLLAERFQEREGSRAGLFSLKSNWIPRAGTTVQTAFSVLTLEHALYRR